MYVLIVNALTFVRFYVIIKIIFQVKAQQSLQTTLFLKAYLSFKLKLKTP